jgi:hypothetical protein
MNQPDENTDARMRYPEIGRKLRAIPPDPPETSHEWEELVERLCESDDAELHSTGLRELEQLQRCRDSR